MKSEGQNVTRASDMETSACASIDQIGRYVKCLLGDEESELLESHFCGCPRCQEALVAIVDHGVGPEWLNVCRDTIGSQLRSDKSSSSASFDQTVIHATAKHDAGPEAPTERGSRGTNERYRFEKQIGEGGMGVVWEGWDTVMRRRVALKCLKSTGNLKVLGPRLLQEAASLARLSHPNIMAVFEVFNEDSRPTLVMEYVDGPTLSHWRGGKIVNERQAAALMEQLARAVQHAHDNGVVHRDLKPSNILLSPVKDNREANDLDTFVPKLSDFGLARIIDEQHLTQTGDMLGTPAYMAPEQTLGVVAAIGPSADIYGLGAILYDLLTGTPPHVAQDPVSTLSLVRERDPVAPRLLRPELSKDLETISLKCLRKSSSDRYASAGDLAADLRAFLEGRVIKARPLGIFSTVVRWGRRHKLLTSALAASLLSLLALVVGSLQFASAERSLRKKADDAAILANKAETSARAEAQRADEAKEAVQQQLRVTLGVAQRLLALRDTVAMRETVRSAEIVPEIAAQAITIHESYVASLPDPENWTFREAIDALRSFEIQGFQAETKVPQWFLKIPSILDRIERENSSNSDRHDVRLLYAKCMAGLEASRNNHPEAAKWNLQLAELIQRSIEIDRDDVGTIRILSHAYMNAALYFSLAQQKNESTVLADRSVAAYRKLLELTNEPENDRVNFIEKLVWQARFYRDVDDKEKFTEIESEAIRHLMMLPEGSEHQPRIDQARSDFQQIRDLLFPM